MGPFTPKEHLHLLVLLISMSILVCDGGKVLVVPMDGSHWVNMDFLIQALHQRGHTVTVLRSSKSWYVKERAPHYGAITVPVSEGFDEDFVNPVIKRLIEAQRSNSSMLNFMGLHAEMFNTMVKAHRITCEMATNIFEDQALMRTLNESRFDLVLTDPCLGTGILLAHFLHLPLVYNVRWITAGEGHFAIAPSPLSYIPLTGLGLSDKITFLDRTKNVLFYLLNEFHQWLRVKPQYQAVCDRYFSPKVDFSELLQAADIWLMRVDFVFEFPRPTMPNVVYMGGFQCVPAKVLPEELELFVESSGEHGVIVMSLGTFVKELPPDMTDEIAAAFAQLPQKIIWRFPGDRLPPALGNNTLLVNWMPQNDLLGHPKVKLFVAHGGTNGIQEAIYHGVPVVGLPIYSDQLDNLVRLRERGAAKILSIATVNRASFLQALQEVLHEPSYSGNMLRLSRLHRDQPMKPLDRALFWIEFVMRHRGAGHLRTESYKLPWFSYYSIDVVLALLTVMFTLTLLVVALVRHLCVTLCCRERKSKKE
ncbi:hypothetical protein AALO_G00204520 [Alosa alosa]|uniref:UDP-glucuronosyltransferase n=1 Tax=Alosa alosa TaxID=278164 RepID=A0AAV6G7Y5_9TELE|nr:UDP-glucuronosyltransferase 2C1-like [Alosa alosa]KAG5269661.1 hypothetical protein AALO_G00204520 [Alosa alosa]